LSGTYLQRFAAELLGTALLVGIGTGSIVEAARLGGEPQWILAVAWFFALAIPAFLFWRVSGAHFNPAITLSRWAAGALSSNAVLPYVTAQISGAFLGSISVLFALGDHANLGATVPVSVASFTAGVAEFAFTFALALSVAWELQPTSRWHSWKPLVPSLVVAVSTFLIGPWTGSSLNPARTLAPAVLSGTFNGIGIYLLSTPLGALAAIPFDRRWRRNDRKRKPTDFRSDPRK